MGIFRHMTHLQMSCECYGKKNTHNQLLSYKVVRCLTGRPSLAGMGLAG